MNHTKNLFKLFIVAGAMTVISPAHASFEGYYNVINWQTTPTPGSEPLSTLAMHQTPLPWLEAITPLGLQLSTLQ